MPRYYTPIEVRLVMVYMLPDTSLCPLLPASFEEFYAGGFEDDICCVHASDISLSLGFGRKGYDRTSLSRMYLTLSNQAGVRFVVRVVGLHNLNKGNIVLMKRFAVEGQLRNGERLTVESCELD